MTNTGKLFENAIKRSVPKYVLLYRLPDAAQSFGGGNKLRFSRKNPFDYLMWDSEKRILYALELKTVGGKSISFERTSEDRGEIHLHQIDGLSEWDGYAGTICGFIIEFRALETTVFIRIEDLRRLIGDIDKKSFSKKDLDEMGIPYVVIPQKKIKTRYKYDIASFLEKMEVAE